MALAIASCVLFSAGLVPRKLASPAQVRAHLHRRSFPVVASDTIPQCRAFFTVNHQNLLQVSRNSVCCKCETHWPIIFYSPVRSLPSLSKQLGKPSGPLVTGVSRLSQCPTASRWVNAGNLLSSEVERCSVHFPDIACSAPEQKSGGVTSGAGLRHWRRFLKAVSFGARTCLNFPLVVERTMLSSAAGSDRERKPCVDRTACLQAPQMDQDGMLCVVPGDVGSVEGLVVWLEERMPGGSAGIQQWGHAHGTKRVANLWTELVQGEIVLEDARPPKRIVHVASVRIRNQAGHILLESRQEMGDGSVRARNRPLSEKMRPRETVAQACLRGIREELGDELGARERVTLREETYVCTQEERNSFSYPGLMTRYIVHTMDAFVERLPDQDFETEENEEHPTTSGLSTSDAKELDLEAEGWDVERKRKEAQGGLQGYGGGKMLEQDMQVLASKGPVGVKKHFWIWVSEDTYQEVVT